MNGQSTWRDSRWFSGGRSAGKRVDRHDFHGQRGSRNVADRADQVRQDAFWRNADVAKLKDGEQAVLGDSILGHSGMRDLDSGFRPAGIVNLSERPSTTCSTSRTTGPCTTPGATHNLVLFRVPSGALVFGAGTVQYDRVDNFHDNFQGIPAERADAYSIRVGYEQRGPIKAIQQATVNLFADMGVQPRAGSLQRDLVPAERSTGWGNALEKSCRPRTAGRQRHRDDHGDGGRHGRDGRRGGGSPPTRARRGTRQWEPSDDLRVVRAARFHVDDHPDAQPTTARISDAGHRRAV